MSAVLQPKKLLAAARPEEAAKVLAARHGPPEDRPALRKDLGIRRQVQIGEVVWIVKNPERMKYYQFKAHQWELILLFDGTRTRVEILEEINRHAVEPIELEWVLEYEEWLRHMELIEQSVAERNLTLLDKFKTLRHKKAEQKSEGFNIFFIMFHVLDPNRFLNRTVKYVRWIWTPPVVAATLVASAWTVGVFINHWEPIWTGTKDLYHFFGKPFLDILHFFFILSIIGGIHEFCHAYATKIYGGEVHDIGFALFYFTPAFYCDTSDSFMFTNRFQRLWVTIAGIYIEAIICSLATALWVASYPDTFVNQFAYKTMLLTGVSTVFFNINPLIKVDGYYALSSLLQLQDLREGAFRTVGAWFQRNILRLPVEVPITTRRKRRIYTFYGTLSMTYTASIMFLIGKLFNNLYTKYVPDFAVVLLLLTLYYLFRKRVRTARRVAKLFYLDKKEFFMSRRSRGPLAAIGAVVLLILMVPWSRRTIPAEAILKPSTRVRVEAPEEGVVEEVLAREGDTVRRGQPLFRLASPAADEEVERHRVKLERFLKKSSQGREAANAALVFQSERRASSAQAALKSAEAQRGFLLVRSPIAGRILTPRTEDLTGRYVVEGTSLAEIGDCRRMVAEVGVPERFLEYLQVGAPVTALIRTRPMKPRTGSIAAISPATLEQPSTVTAGREPVPPSAHPDRFVALAVFDNPDGTLLPGAAAKVKIRSKRDAYALRAWSVFWRWLRALVW